MDYLLDTGRWKEVKIPTMQDGFVITVAVIYGYSGASSSNKEYKANERLLTVALRRARLHKDVPYIIGGDLNININSSKI